MDPVMLRAPRDDDWLAILELAELSLSEMKSAPSQLEWLHNRRSFSSVTGFQEHVVASTGDRIVGYACLERRHQSSDGEYRLFVVVAPSARATLGSSMLAMLRERLIAANAGLAWMVEYESDPGFLSFLESKGFKKMRSYHLDNGNAVVALAIDAPFQSLTEPTSCRSRERES
jgi:hypothetical protein